MKNSNPTNVVSSKNVIDLTKKGNNEKFLKAKIESVKNETEIDFSKLDFSNLEKVVINISDDCKKTAKKDIKYMCFGMTDLNKSEHKKIRKDARNDRDILIVKFNDLHIKKDYKNLHLILLDWEKFYVERYNLNDYTRISICSNTADLKNQIMCEEFINLIKGYKVTFKID